MSDSSISAKLKSRQEVDRNNILSNSRKRTLSAKLRESTEISKRFCESFSNQPSITTSSPPSSNIYDNEDNINKKAHENSKLTSNEDNNTSEDEVKEISNPDKVSEVRFL